MHNDNAQGLVNCAMEAPVKALASPVKKEMRCTEPLRGDFHQDVIPVELRQKAPLLVGEYVQQEQHAIWRGRWGMSDAAFLPNGLTSPFEMKSMEAVNVRLCTGNKADIHPAFHQQLLARSMTLPPSPSNASPAMEAQRVNPVWFGYASKQLGDQVEPVPYEGVYEGYFQIQAGKGKVTTVEEKNVHLRFVHDVAQPTRLLVFGHGENKFGAFRLHGAMDKVSKELRIYKVYQPKEKEKRVLPRRGRIPRAVLALSNNSATSSQASSPTNPAEIHCNMDDGNKSASVSPRGQSVARGRSERKRSLPARLREDTVSDSDNVAVLKKCLTILKTLMVNPKAGPFLAPVDPVALGLPDYFKVIKEPMDLGTIRQKLEQNLYKDPVEVVNHVRLTFQNAMLYNAAHSQVHIFAQKLLEDFEKKIKNLHVKSPSGSTTPVAALANPCFSFANAIVTPTSAYAGSKSKKRHLDSTTSTFGSSGSRKMRGGKGSKGNVKRNGVISPNQDLIMSLKADIERLTAKLEQIQQPKSNGSTTPKLARTASRPFKMEDLTEEELTRPMTQMEKARLSSDLRRLPQDKINRVLQIISEAVPVSQLTNEHDEVELDINVFDTRCLRMLEGYVRENGIGRKRKRPTATVVGGKKPRSYTSTPSNSASGKPVENRLSSAKLAAANIQSRKEQLVTQLAAMEKHDSHGPAPPDHDVGMTDADRHDDDEEEDGGHSSDSGNSSDGSSSSDSDSDSDSDMEHTAHSHVADPVIW